MEQHVSSHLQGMTATLTMSGSLPAVTQGVTQDSPTLRPSSPALPAVSEESWERGRGQWRVDKGKACEVSSEPAEASFTADLTTLVRLVCHNGLAILHVPVRGGSALFE